MNRDEFDALGDKHKKYEQLNKPFLMPNLPIMVRVDGRAFHTFTKGLNRPFDVRLTLCMHETAKTLLEKFNGYISYVQSDEISLIINGNETGRMFGGSRDKLISLISATASVAFYKALIENLPQKAHELPIFDCRAFQYPTLDLYAENLMWREADATRNSLTMLCHAHFSKDALHKVNRQKQHDMLHSIGINWDSYPNYFKRGSYFAKRDKLVVMSDEIWDKIPEGKKPESKEFLRSITANLDLPPVSTINNFVDVIFNKASPKTCN